MNAGLNAAPSVATGERGRRTLREVLSFLAVGGVGFLIEAVILTLLTLYAEWSPWQARIPSFVTAVLVTWALNRRHTFPNRGLSSRSTEAFFYTTIQGGGALINLGIFGICLALWPTLAQLPVIPLAIGAVGGFACNYLFSSKWLYSRYRSDHSG